VQFTAARQWGNLQIVGFRQLRGISQVYDGGTKLLGGLCAFFCAQPALLFIEKPNKKEEKQE
jgi:hypothetical protein